MSQPDLQNMTDQPNTWHMLRAMGGVGILCAVLIVFTFQATLPAIETNKAAALEKAIFAVIPGASTKIAFKLNENKQFEEVEKAEKGVRVVYAGYNDQNELVGVAIEANGQGFQDIIRVIYGYSPESQAIIGFQVLESKETPGLGDKIEKDEHFLQNFDGLDISVTDDQNAIKNPIVPVKKGEKVNPWEIDCITGATISSKAVANLLRNNTGELIPLLVQNIETLKKAKTATDLSAVQH
ncbi:MAG: FMN-binding protein [Calditrichaeota bacterium]|nr:FMN-binding protein [Calditrichota bacterium]MCB0299881.1 FMN-binding protein [Calditrichota bacterium]MCB9070458.1 FMN-binding protein [Calditrichia bacterium]